MRHLFTRWGGGFLSFWSALWAVLGLILDSKWLAWLEHTAFFVEHREVTDQISLMLRSTPGWTILPIGVAGIFLIWLDATDRGKRVASKLFRKPEGGPMLVMVFGLLTFAAGAAWHYHTDSQEVHGGISVAPPPPTEGATGIIVPNIQTASPSQVPYTSYDREKREKVIDAALPIFETELSTLASEGDILGLHARGESSEEHLRSAENLRIYQEKSQKIFSKILKLRGDNKQYDDIYQSLSAPDEFLVAIQGLVDAVNVVRNQTNLTKDDARSQGRVLSNYAAALEKNAHSLKMWAEREASNLTEYRKRTYR